MLLTCISFSRHEEALHGPPLLVLHFVAWPCKSTLGHGSLCKSVDDCHLIACIQCSAQSDPSAVRKHSLHKCTSPKWSLPLILCPHCACETLQEAGHAHRKRTQWMAWQQMTPALPVQSGNAMSACSRRSSEAARWQQWQVTQLLLPWLPKARQSGQPSKAVSLLSSPSTSGKAALLLLLCVLPASQGRC